MDIILIANQLHIAMLSLATVYFTCMKKLGVHWPQIILASASSVAVEQALSVLPLALGRLASPLQQLHH